MTRAFLSIVEPAQISPPGPGYSPPTLLGVLAAHILLCELRLVKGQPLWHGCSLWEFKGQDPLSPCGIPLKSYSLQFQNYQLAEDLLQVFVNLFLPLPKPAFLTPHRCS